MKCGIALHVIWSWTWNELTQFREPWNCKGVHKHHRRLRNAMRTILIACLASAFRTSNSQHHEMYCRCNTLLAALTSPPTIDYRMIHHKGATCFKKTSITLTKKRSLRNQENSFSSLNSEYTEELLSSRFFLKESKDKYNVHCTMGEEKGAI